MIPVSKPFLPPFEEYTSYISKLWDTKWLTNNGTYVRQLEAKIGDYLNTTSIQFVSNGTIALQIAIKALNIKNEIITTPFSYVATTTSILWENCKPVFVDIDPNTLCIDVNKIEDSITNKTEAILATHVYGIPCDVDEISKIAKKYNLKVIYDGAHAFGVRYKGRSLLSYGDISTLSFHATKLFHTIEGGAIINNSGEYMEQRIKYLRNFGYDADNLETVGINGKNSEFHAAMGLCNLKYIANLIENRRRCAEKYDSYFLNRYTRPKLSDDIEYNYAYYPIIFESERELLFVMKELKKNNIETRRYFYPSLNNLPYINTRFYCPISENISKRILCLPLYSDLSILDVEKICESIKDCEVRLYSRKIGEV
ncbi:DegT/DnrJ/EryC1/StrS family aminotransferase [Heyndrickxia oleronia]|jgi:dTDP-4-amino-4,6-dideoxygalactose transaminase|uniref:DegT/DnrJ/EryC1/StrS family aminotransferase n=1 Tax=Heyndrickxia oleronia TaxID=38875 RepID=UPI00242B30AF|nr:DegT/DnrJ/EryC1/StrS family aminotransferase [Heyndrickxia oleronia]MCI1590686.1 DegT/DnrJ/EryC1/StrS family aminotransferase [Heyndrickxia oleronia]MCI1612125.1 DegT/DnrJ/EryC1/StrS family aminotransferase [Heyndrickxia oleronia]MCI1759834.1 DegT/DnrJ/EryC1/StrS family aminotransferase [Heyndrickxia oleronia]